MDNASSSAAPPAVRGTAGRADGPGSGTRSAVAGRPGSDTRRPATAANRSARRHRRAGTGTPSTTIHGDPGRHVAIARLREVR